MLGNALSLHHTDTRIIHRPLLHPAIRPPHQTLAANEPSIIYISPSTPFISAVKRARKLLEKVRREKLKGVTLKSLENPKTGRQQFAKGRVDVVEDGSGNKRGRTSDGGGKVIFRGAGRAINRTLQLGLYFTGQEGIAVKVETGTTFAIDDLEVLEDDGMVGVEGEKNHEDSAEEEKKRVGEEGMTNKAEIPETRLRKLGYVQVVIWEDLG